MTSLDSPTPEGRRCPECGHETMPVSYRDGTYLECMSCDWDSRPTPAPEGGERDWIEDFAHENGNYSGTCIHCGLTFIGHKRRVACRKCATPTSAERGEACAHGWTGREGLGPCVLCLSPTPAATGEEGEDAILSTIRARLGASERTDSDAPHFRADVRYLLDRVDTLRRRLAEAEADASKWRNLGKLPEDATRELAQFDALIRRATTAERRLADAANAIPEVSGPVDERIRVLRQHHADQLTTAERRLEEKESDLGRIYAALPDGPKCWGCADTTVAGRCDETGRPCHPADDAARYVAEAVAAQQEVARLREALKSAADAVAFSPRDMSLHRCDAWVYGILLGWDEALSEVSARHGWAADEVARLTRLRAALSTPQQGEEQGA